MSFFMNIHPGSDESSPGIFESRYPCIDEVAAHLSGSLRSCCNCRWCWCIFKREEGGKKKRIKCFKAFEFTKAHGDTADRSSISTLLLFLSGTESTSHRAENSSWKAEICETSPAVLEMIVWLCPERAEHMMAVGCCSWLWMVEILDHNNMTISGNLINL